MALVERQKSAAIIGRRIRPRFAGLGHKLASTKNWKAMARLVPRR